MRSPALLLLLLGCARGPGDDAAPTAPPPLPPTSPDLWLGGDLYYGDRDPQALLAPLAPLTAGAVGIVNLEGAVAPGGAFATTPEGYRLHNDPAGLQGLREAGIAAVGIANNHAADADPHDTARHVSDAGLLPAGAVSVPLGSGTVRLVQVDLTGGAPPDLAARLRDGRTPGEPLVASFHVTGPPSFLPRPELHEAVTVALAEGASVVVAHGTHAIAPVERRGGAVIAWGLGNLAMACDCTAVTDALLLRVHLSAGGRVGDARVYPLRAGLRGEAATPAPDPAGLFDLLTAIGSPPLIRAGSYATLPGS